MKYAIFSISGFLLMLASFFRGEFWIGALIIFFFFLREQTDSLTFTVVAFLLGIFFATLNRQTWWLEGILWWLPVALTFSLAKYLGIESKTPRRFSLGLITLTLWFAVFWIKAILGHTFFIAYPWPVALTAFVTLLGTIFILETLPLLHEKVFR